MTLRLFSLPSLLLFILTIGSSGTAVAQSDARVWAFHRSNHSWLGVSVQDVTKKLVESKKLKATSGAYVSEVLEDSPAEKAGVLEGDVITRIDGRIIDDRDDLVSSIRRADPGDEVKVVVDRKGESKTLTATIEEAETPRAMMTIPDVPSVAKVHPMPFGSSFFVSGSRLGMELQTLGKQLAEYFDIPGNRGVLVSSVDKKGAAARAGVKAGDVIVRVNRNSVRDIGDVMDEVHEAEADSIPFEVMRKGKSMTFTIETSGGDDDLSYHRHHPLDGVLEEIRAAQGEDFDREEFSRELREAIRELQRSLREGAMDLRRELNRSFRES